MVNIFSARRWLIAVVLGTSTLVLPALSSADPLPAQCVQAEAAGLVTCTYTSGATALTLPEGVTSVQVTAIGGRGGNYVYSGGAFIPGGKAAVVASTVSVPAETRTLYVSVGGNGGDFVGQSTGATGGANGGGNSGRTEAGPAGNRTGGGGGGASDIRTGPDDLATRVVVAGGGGGSGTDGEGGDAGAPGVGPLGGGAGTIAAGGAGGDTASSRLGQAGSGSFGVGGTGGEYLLGNVLAINGGGGGGGWYGGGGGGAGSVTLDGIGLALGGAGGGGSSLAPDGGTASVTTSPPSVTIAYLPATSTPQPPACTGSVCLPGGSLGSS